MAHKSYEDTISNLKLIKWKNTTKTKKNIQKSLPVVLNMMIKSIEAEAYKPKPKFFNWL